MSFPKRENLQKKKRQLLIIVGSRNPVKINSTDAAFHQCFEDSFIVQGINVTSDVADQPVGDAETLQGALNRAENAKNAFPEADFWLGIEGGVDEDRHGMNAFAWVVVLDKADKIGKAKTSTFYLPEVISKLVKGGMELGKADDSFFNRENSKETDGAVGILTNGAVNRKTYYEQAIILALVPFMNAKIY
ncbi:inosine/xanthosine triphosphatase [Litoribacter ruber]|uniref:Probable inosine/xanthosine triphosphatase n=1 Tax=Litoribacter ruber TaxID=702568 RepID=A0AAP2G118_9BACT|nr:MULTISPECIES: inosine/xanthosine triphosphatase [Litoribacter]MBS9523342.1 inosine/xanthosine triphosphatase [Litoribacter alkaliphilus]MBT0812532.1 inosine/xanthosine triphosphatase [Litoribacter ruber]